MITGLIHPPQTTEWLTEIDRVTSLQDLGTCWICIRQLPDEYSQNAKGLVRIMNSEFKREIQLAAKNTRKNESPDVDRRSDRFHIYASFRGESATSSRSTTISKSSMRLGEDPNSTGEGTRSTSFGRQLPSAVGEVDFFAERLGAFFIPIRFTREKPKSYSKLNARVKKNHQRTPNP